jgi:membrane protein implicated in regulation of membrane protease activity
MSDVIGVFRRTKLSWFLCPHCGHRSWRSSVRGEYRADRVPRYRMICKCDACSGLCTLAPWRTWIQIVTAFALSFPSLYLIFATQPAHRAVLFALVAALLLLAWQSFLGRVLNRYEGMSEGAKQC